MGNIQTPWTYGCDLDRGTVEVTVSPALGQNDALADVFQARVHRSGRDVSIDGMTVRGYMYFPATRKTILLPGEAKGNIASVTLTPECYLVPGYASIAIQLQNGEVVQTLLKADVTITRTNSDDVIDPENIVPTLPELLARIAEMKQATDQAHAATEAAKNATAELLATSAPPIIPTATGEVVAVHDSAERPFAGLRLYGKTTQDGTPTPSAPVPLVTVGAGGSINITACGKNLIPFPFKLGNYSGNGVTINQNDDGSISVKGTATAQVQYRFFDWITLPAGKYTITDYGNEMKNNLLIGVYSQDWATIALLRNGVNSATFELTKPTAIRAQCIMEAGATANWAWVRPVLTYGEASGAFESYKDGGGLTASTPNGLPGIPVTSGGNCTDTSGQMWLCDEIDFERGVYVQRVDQWTMDGAENWTLSTGGAGRFVTYVLSGKVKPVASSAQIAPLVCTAYQTVSADALYATSGAYYIAQNNEEIWVSKTGFDSADAFKTHLAANPMTVLYALKTPVETALSADVIAAYRAMTTHKPTTTVYNDAGAGLGVDYVADTKTYIDQRIAALLNA